MTRQEEIEWAWAAGFFDGEGSTMARAKKKGARPFIRLAVSQTDERILVRFMSAVGEGKVRGPYIHPTRKCSPLYYWICGHSAAERVLDGMWPYLGIAKREQAERVRTKRAEHIAAHPTQINIFNRKDILKALENGASIRSLARRYEVSRSRIYGLKKREQAKLVKAST